MIVTSVVTSVVVVTVIVILLIFYPRLRSCFGSQGNYVFTRENPAFDGTMAHDAASCKSEAAGKSGGLAHATGVHYQKSSFILLL